MWMLRSAISWKGTVLECRHSSCQYGYAVLALSSSFRVPKRRYHYETRSGLFGRSIDSTASYRVAKVTKDGDLQYINMQTSEILKSAPSLYARDLFSLQLTTRQERTLQRGSKKIVPPRRPPPAILPRRDSIVVCFGNLQAVATREYVLIFDAHHPVVQQFSQDLVQRIREIKDFHRQELEIGYTNHEEPQHQEHRDAMPMELIFLEEVLRDTCITYSRRIRMFEPIVDSFLNKVSNEAFSDSGLHLLVPVKDSLQSLEMQVKQSLDTIAELLHNDDDMVALLLTEQAQARKDGNIVPLESHEEVELLLEEYARQLSSALSDINYLLQRVQSKQEFVALALSSYRNRIARMNVIIDIAGVSLGIGTLVAGFFGMNLLSGMEETPGVFYAVILTTSFAGIVVATTSMSYLSGRFVQKRAASRLDEIETLSSALSDMRALDYTLKSALELRGAKPMNKDEFRQEFKRARYSRRVTDKEVELLFNIFDIVKDGHIGNDDFASSQFPAHLEK